MSNMDTRTLLAIYLLIRRRRRRRRWNAIRNVREPVVQCDELEEEDEETEDEDQAPSVQDYQEPEFQDNVEVVQEDQKSVDGHDVVQEPAVTKQRGGSRPNRKWWVRPSLAETSARDHCKRLQNTLRADPEKFRQHYQLTVSCFYDILSRIEKVITGTDTFMRDAVDPETKLAATLRYLTVGSTYRVIAEEFHLGRSTVAHIVRNVCNAIWKFLRSPYLEEPGVEEFLKISEDYERKLDFPHCLGSVGGRYLRVKQKSTVTDLFIFNNHRAVAMVALVDSNYFFRYVDVSGYRQENDLFKATSLGATILEKTLTLPKPRTVPNFPDPLPYVFVSKDFFLSDNVLRPFLRKALTPQKVVFNNKIEKAMDPLDSALTLLTSKFRILQRPFEMAVEGTETIVKACCVLHNLSGDHDGFPPVDDLAPCAFDHLEPGLKISLPGGSNVRSLFVNYFNS